MRLPGTTFRRNSMAAEHHQHDKLKPIGQEVTSQLYRKNAEALLSGSLLAVLMLAVLWGSNSPAMLLGWLLVVELAYAGRYVLARAYHRSPSQHDRRWLHRFRIGVTLQGLAWGVGAYLLFPSHDAVSQSGLLLVVVGLAAGAAISYVIDEITLLGFQGSLLLPLFVRLLGEGTAHAYVMALMVVTYLVYIGVVVRRSYRPIRENIRLKLEAGEREETIREQNDFLNTILESEPECVKVIAADGELLQMNRAGLTMLEVGDVEEARKTGLINFIDPEFRSDFSDLFKKVLQNQADKLEFRIRGKRGTRRWLETHASPLRDAQGKVTGIVAVTRDVTERKQTMLALQESEFRFRNIMENAPIGMVITSVDGHLLMVNQAYCDMLGYNKEELNGLTYMDITHPDDRTIVLSERQQLLDDEIESYRKEKRYLRKDGQVLWVLLTSSVVKSASGADPYFIAQVEDITERKQAEARLRQSESEYRHLIDMLPYGVLIHRAGNILQANKAAAAIFGAASPAELVDYPILQLVHPDYVEVVKERIRAAVDLGRDSTVIEEKLVRLDGTPFHAEVAAISVMLQNQPASLAVINDINQRKQAEETETRLLRTNNLLFKCDSLLIRSSNEQELLEGICKLMVEAGGYVMAWVGYAEQDAAKSVVPVARSGYEDGYLEEVRITWADEPEGRGPAGTSIRTGKAVTSQDYQTNPAMLAEWRDAAKKRRFNSSIALPLNVEGKSIGAFCLYSERKDAFGREEVGLLESLANDLSYGIQATRVQQALRREGEKSAELLRNASDGIHIMDGEGNLVEVSDSFCTMLGYPRDELIGKNITLWDAQWSDSEVMRVLTECFELGQGSHRTYETLHKRRDGSTFPVEITTHVFALEGKLLLYSSSRDITERKRHEQQLVQSEQRLQEILNVSPIAVRIASHRGRRVEFCNQAYINLIRNSRPVGDDPRNYYAHSRDYDEILAELAQGSVVINRQIELRIPGNVTIWALASYMPIQYQDEPAVLGWFYDITEIKKSEAEIRIAATAFESQEGMLITDADANILRVNSAFTEITGYTAAEAIGKNPRMLSSGYQDSDFYTEMWRILEDSGAWEGEIWNRRKNGEIYPERLAITVVRDQHGNVTNYVASMSDITQYKRSEEEIQRLAYYDHLTGLPNRRMLMDRLGHALSYTSRGHRQGALLFIDLDNFKILNDTLGHALGDMLLQQVSQRLASCVREGDTVARFGGDEFVVMLDDLSEEPFEASEQAKVIGEKIVATLAFPYQLATHEFTCTPSLGITLFHGRDQNVDELLKQADIAMYQAKNAGRNTLRFFDNQMQQSINARASLETELRNAMERDQFRLYYQIQRTSEGSTFGVEALIRWHHPERGPISPAQFIPVAEETGLILPIGAWVIETACAQLKAWAHDRRTNSLVLAVNVSAKQFHQASFASQVKKAIEDHAVNPSLLKLELTESMLLENVEDTIAIMHDLNEIGVQLALDDFGTGYSSLQYLKRLPLDQLKIDQSFVRDIAFDSNDLAIVHTIIAMAHSLYLDVIAEGVETEEQCRLLLDSGCTHYQGYLFGKPMPIEAFEDSLKQG